MQNDFSPAEEEEVRRENQWAFDWLSYLFGAVGVSLILRRNPKAGNPIRNVICVGIYRVYTGGYTGGEFEKAIICAMDNYQC